MFQGTANKLSEVCSVDGTLLDMAVDDAIERHRWEDGVGHATYGKLTATSTFIMWGPGKWSSQCEAVEMAFIYKYKLLSFEMFANE